MNSTPLLSLGNVKAFRGHSVIDGVVRVTHDEFVSYLDGFHDAVMVCNVAMEPGKILRHFSPGYFCQLLGSYWTDLQIQFSRQLETGNDVDMDFHN